MAGVLDTLTESGAKIPFANVDLSNVGTYLIYFLVGIVFASGIGFGLYAYLQNKKYNLTLVIHKKINGKIVPVYNDKGMLQRVGKAGDYWLYAKKGKKRLVRPKIYAGKNLIWYYERQADGEWVNFEIEDIDEKMQKAGAYFVDEDMRLSRLGIQKNLDERLMKETFWKKYGQSIMMIIFIVMVTICLVVLFQQLKTLPPAISETASAVTQMAVSVSDMAKRIGIVNNSLNGVEW
jgi:hypothetical protein